MAVRRVMRQFAAMGGIAQVREKDGLPLVTDNGQHIVDVTGLRISDPLGFESEVSQWPGVVTVGVFAHQKADVCLLGTATGVKTMAFRLRAEQAPRRIRQNLMPAGLLGPGSLDAAGGGAGCAAGAAEARGAGACCATSGRTGPLR